MEDRSILRVGGIRLAGVRARLGSRVVVNDDEKLVKATGIRRRRVAAADETSLSLCLDAARELLAAEKIDAAALGAIVSVTFTPARRMPCNACAAQAALGAPKSVLAFDLGLACSGYPYGLYVAALLCRETGRPVLLLDGDVQTPFIGEDRGMAPLLSDAGTASLVVPCAGAAPWYFTFLTDGAQAEALTCGDAFRMDGFGVFKFVATDVANMLAGFLSALGTRHLAPGTFIPHQANVYMIEQLAKKLGLREQLVITADEVGNCASASIPVSLALHSPLSVDAASVASPRQVLLAGFGGGLSASAALITL